MIVLEQSLRESARQMIAKCKLLAYGRPAGNVKEGDYGTWKDWEDVLVKFAVSRILKEGMHILVSDPKHEDSMHQHGFSATVVTVHPTNLTVKDQEDQRFDIDFDEVESLEEE